MHQHDGSLWQTCVLCRTKRQSQAVYEKAVKRKIQWPQPKDHQATVSPIEDPLVYTSIDDAFTSVMQYISSTSRQCKRYYKSCPASHLNSFDTNHCDRFHTPNFSQDQHRNPLEATEDVHLVVHPGTYAVTAGEWGTKRQQTHVVHVESGQSVNLDFVM